MHRRIAAGIAALTLTVGLSACAASGQSYADLERDQTDQDRLPVSTPGGGSDDPLAIDADSTRLVAVQGDTEIFLASATEQGQARICIIVFAATQPFRACGDGDQVTMSDSVNSYTVLSDAVVDTQLDPDEGWTKISENVFTRPVEPTTSDTQ